MVFLILLLVSGSSILAFWYSSWTI